MAEMSYMTSTNNQTEVVAKYNVYCEQGAIHCLYKTSRQLMWSVFGLTNLKQLESHTSLTSEIVAVLYLIFLILSVIMLVNILVALLNNTYTNVTANAEVEWKYSRAVAENQYRNLHCIVVPFNLLSVPLKLLYFKTNGNRNSRKEDADNRLKKYRIFYRDWLFPTITKRYTKNYGGSLPLSIEEKIDLIIKDKLQISNFDESSTEKLNEYLAAFKDRITESTSVVVHFPKNESTSNGVGAKPSLTDCHIQLSSIA